MQYKLLFGTNNLGKIRELNQLLKDIKKLDIISPTDIDLKLDIPETGESYKENALLKARAFAEESGYVTLADDSGLEVDALAGAPGIFSARYANKKGAAQLEHLLKELKGIPENERSAKFRCVVAIAVPQGDAYTFEGSVGGQIGFKPSGKHGFGYDPIFFMPEFGKTMAELDEETKNQISHRAKAVQAALPTLIQIFEI